MFAGSLQHLRHCGSNPLLIVIDCGCYTSVGFDNAYNTVVYTVSIGGYAVCPVGDSDKIVICVISICDSSVIGVDNLGKIAHCVILIANDLAVGVGIARQTVESIVGSGDRAVGCRLRSIRCRWHRKYSLQRLRAKYSPWFCPWSHRNLTACVGDLFAYIQLVVLVALDTARNGGLGCESAHIVVGVIGCTADRTGKTGYIAEQIVGCRAYVVCCIANLGTASSIDSRNSFWLESYWSEKGNFSS